MPRKKTGLPEHTGAFVFMLIRDLDEGGCECPRLTPSIMSRLLHVSAFRPFWKEL